MKKFTPSFLMLSLLATTPVMAATTNTPQTTPQSQGYEKEMPAKQFLLEKSAKVALAKVHGAFPETKQFQITHVLAKQENGKQTFSVTLEPKKQKSKAQSTRLFTVTLDGKTGDIEYIGTGQTFTLNQFPTNEKAKKIAVSYLEKLYGAESHNYEAKQFSKLEGLSGKRMAVMFQHKKDRQTMIHVSVYNNGSVNAIQKQTVQIPIQ
ncbi:hypothetical protein [Aneurinibacillus uraniidurans]|uniref:hypothetical protein n=1 Tax=Aneurinibacillus uraniidurans TaxID=2966586 RepID=UPI002348F360|nr:hypothetical protein [Aneurinibacillus sp. B1]WCN39184.1 hypothetical protein PO771_07270 [Aneurinibacillus sp. B1]